MQNAGWRAAWLPCAVEIVFGFLPVTGIACTGPLRADGTGSGHQIVGNVLAVVLKDPIYYRRTAQKLN